MATKKSGSPKKTTKPRKNGKKNGKSPSGPGKKTAESVEAAAPALDANQQADELANGILVWCASQTNGVSTGVAFTGVLRALSHLVLTTDVSQDAVLQAMPGAMEYVSKRLLSQQGQMIEALKGAPAQPTPPTPKTDRGSTVGDAHTVIGSDDPRAPA